MKKVFAVFLCAAVLLGTGIQGLVTSRNRHCLCLSASSNSLPKERFGNVTVHPAKAHCDRVEIIVTLKASGTKQCLNPDSKTVKAWLARTERKRPRKIVAAGRRSPQ
ncbi:C-X-C motif chemokine 10-like [Paroedura picta]|uniref:C-X-C motif chemokine 10-like n=1 Tax=Paroedura picta TaxID=143630 RepID=UPI00405642BE